MKNYEFNTRNGTNLNTHELNKDHQQGKKKEEK